MTRKELLTSLNTVIEKLEKSNIDNSLGLTTLMKASREYIDKSEETKNTVYLVDFENVNSTLLTDENALQEGDEVVIFYSDNTNRLSMDVLAAFKRKNVKTDYVHVEAGVSNALDYQLDTYLGSMIALDRKGKYRIVSHDNGFRVVCHFWRQKQDVDIEMIPCIGTPKPEVVQVDNESQKKIEKNKNVVQVKAKTSVEIQYPLLSQKEALKACLKTVISEKKVVKSIISTIEMASTREEVHRCLQKQYRGEQLKKLNKALKPITDKMPLK